MYSLTVMVIVVGICVSNSTGASPPSSSKSSGIPITASTQQSNRDGTSYVVGPSSVSTESDEPIGLRPRTHILHVENSQATTPSGRRAVITYHSAPIERLPGSAQNVQPQGPYRLIGSANNNPPQRPYHTIIGQKRPHHTVVGPTNTPPQRPRMAQVPPTGAVLTRNQPPKFVPAILRRSRPAAPVVVQPPLQPRRGAYPLWKFIIDRCNAPGVQFVRWENEAALNFKIHDKEAFAEAWKPFSTRYYNRPSLPFSLITSLFYTMKHHGMLQDTTRGSLVYKLVRVGKIADYLDRKAEET